MMILAFMRISIGNGWFSREKSAGMVAEVSARGEHFSRRRSLFNLHTAQHPDLAATTVVLASGRPFR
jgi:hypothetical protein